MMDKFASKREVLGSKPSNVCTQHDAVITKKCNSGIQKLESPLELKFIDRNNRWIRETDHNNLKDPIELQKCKSSTNQTKICNS